MRALVTGGSGFLGRESCRQLVARGTTVSSLSRRPQPRPGEPRHPAAPRRPRRSLRRLPGARRLRRRRPQRRPRRRQRPLLPYWNTNVRGTRHVIAQCRAHGIGTLVHTPTASVVFQPGGLRNADGSCPYPERHLAAYLRTKARAEALVPAANGPGLAAVALRPHIIWGPGDPHFAPALARAVRAGRLVMPGEGANLVDTTHLRTAAHAHLLALDRLRQGGPLSEAAPTSSPRTTPAPCRATWCTVPTAPARAAAATRENVLRLTGRTRTHALSRFRSPSKPASRRSTEPLSPAIPWASRVAHQIGHGGGRVGGSAAVVDDVPDGPGATE
ncbi:NAD-dependent epimerase/dehydratase family protein [Streptomyces sp. NPDC008086]|uniref:NAD-dependent epimerase/dehydratase family protein n=1 Tax=Streptomyces sp. NPDC008086 TaxID=3364807 RepID=UPI0036ED80DE